MPEIKNTFTQGKMNKDLDERIIPNGQYRDALNIKVSSSEDASVGTVQNILGNHAVDPGVVPGDYLCVAAIANEKTNKLYWFVTKELIPIHAILEYDLNAKESDRVKVVLLDKHNSTLKFGLNIITGINIIDDLLFWTDNNNEPKKINIQDCINGSVTGDLDTVRHTQLVDTNGQPTGIDIEESHITVIKKSPKLAPQTTLLPNYDKPPVLFEKIFPRFSYRYKYKDGEYSSFGPFTDVIFNPVYKEEYNAENAYSLAEGNNSGMINNIKAIMFRNYRNNNLPKDVVQIEILYKEEGSSVVFSLKKLNIDDYDFNNNSCILESQEIFAAIPENQLLRPWDNVPRKALAQEVTGNRIVYGNYTQGYDLINSNGSKAISTVVADYEKRDLTQTNNDDFSLGGIPSLKSQREYNVGLVWGDKYGRETTVMENVGNVTVPWFDQNISHLASEATSLRLSINGTAPAWADYYKFFVKENSGEYYNLLMEKAYFSQTVNLFDEEEERIWLGFVSSDRNKLSEQEYIILKRDIKEAQGQVELENKFKILDIQNEAPDAIKYRYVDIGRVKQDSDGSSDFLTNASTGIFTDEDQRPNAEIDMLYIHRSNWVNSLGGSLQQKADNAEMWVENLYASWRNTDTGENSEKYRITSSVFNTTEYMLKLDRKITTTDAELGLGGATSGNLDDDLEFLIEKREEVELEEFTGKFFVQISSLSSVQTEVTDDELKANHQTISKSNTFWFYELASNVAFGNVTTPANEPDQVVDVAGVTGVADTHDDFTALQGTFGNINKGFFIDNLKMVGGQINDANYAKSTGRTWWGRHDRHKITPKWGSLLRTNNPQYSGANIEEYGWGYGWFNGADPGGTGNPDNEDYGKKYPLIDILQNPNESLGSALHNWAQGQFNLMILGQNTQDKRVNSIEGFITTNDDYSGDGSLVGFKKWKKPGLNNNDWGNYFNGGVEHTYGRENGKHYISISFLAPGEDLHDGFDANFIESAPNFGDDSPGNYLQAIWGGGIFNDAVNGYTVEMEGNYDVNDDPLFSAPGPGVGYGYDNSSDYKQRHENQWNPFWKLSSDDKKKIQDFINSLQKGGKFKFSNDDDVIYTIEKNPIVKKVYNHTAWNRDYEWDGTAFVEVESVEKAALTWADSKTTANFDAFKDKIIDFGRQSNRRLVYIFPVNKNAINENDFNVPSTGTEFDAQANLDIQFITANSSAVIDKIIKGPAIWETEPKQGGLDIYYEASQAFPTKLTEKTNTDFAPIHSIVEFLDVDAAKNGKIAIEGSIELVAWETANKFVVSGLKSGADGFNKFFVDDNGADTNIDYNGALVRFHRLDGGYTTGRIVGSGVPTAGETFTETDPDGNIITYTAGPNFVNKFFIEPIDISLDVGLSYFNCFTFGNGIESNRIRDDFNAPVITNGVKASIVLETDYKEENRKSGLIFSGIYNSNSGVNNLNQFIMAENITKDLNPTYGSIQKLFQRRVSLVAFCEDRVVSITSNKDALFNADGNSQLVSTNNVLGDATPFVGDFGISTNPESFAKESYRAYFSDKQRGAVLRLSMDGITPISESGMSDYFRDELKKSGEIVGSYDAYSKNYNITLRGNKPSDNLISNAFLDNGLNGNLDVPAQSQQIINNGSINSGLVALTTPTIDIANNLTSNRTLDFDVKITNHDEILAGSLAGETSTTTTTQLTSTSFTQDNNPSSFATFSFTNTSVNPVFGSLGTHSANDPDKSFQVKRNYTSDFVTDSESGTGINGDAVIYYPDYQYYGPGDSANFTTARSKTTYWYGADPLLLYFGHSGDIIWNPERDSYTDYYSTVYDYNSTSWVSAFAGTGSDSNPWFFTDGTGLAHGLGLCFDGVDHGTGAVFPGVKANTTNASTPANVLAQYPTAAPNTIFNGEEIKLQVFARNFNDINFNGTGGQQGSGSNSDYYRYISIQLYDGIPGDGGVALTDSVLMDPNGAIPSGISPGYAAYQTTVQTDTSYKVGFQTTTDYNFPSLDSNTNQFHQIYFKFTNGVDENEEIIVNDLQVEIMFVDTGNDTSNKIFGAISSLNMKKVYEMSDVDTFQTITTLNGDAMPPSTIPAWAEVERLGPNVGYDDWDFSVNGISIPGDAFATESLALYGDNYIAIQNSGTQADGNVVTWEESPDGGVSNGTLNYGVFGNGTITVNDVIEVDGSGSNVVQIKQAVSFVTGNYYVVDLTLRQGTPTGDVPFITHIVNSVLTNFNFVEQQVKFDFSGTLHGAYRCIFQGDSSNTELAINIPANLVATIHSINMLDVSETWSGGTVNNWDSNLGVNTNPNPSTSFDTPQVYASASDGIVFDVPNSYTSIRQTINNLQPIPGGYILTFDAVVTNDELSFRLLDNDTSGANGLHGANVIDRTGSYRIYLNMDGGTYDVEIDEGAGYVVQHQISAAYPSSSKNQIVFHDSMNFQGSIDNMSLVNAQNIYTGGSADAFTFSGFDPLLNNYIVFNNNRIEFNNCPGIDATDPSNLVFFQVQQEVGNLENGTYKIRFDHDFDPQNGNSGGVNGYYYNSDGNGFIIGDVGGITGAGTYSDVHIITNDPNDPAYHTNPDPSTYLTNTLVIHSNSGGSGTSTTGFIDNILFRQEFVTGQEETISFSENVRGWVSKKSFIPEQGVSLSSSYFTFNTGQIYEHNVEDKPRNNFYGVQYKSTITAMLNEAPSIVKSFNTLNYEGTQSKVNKFETFTDLDGNSFNTLSTYNLEDKSGWKVNYIKTDKQEGMVNEFIEKEGKWFNYIKGSSDVSKKDASNLSFQGLGIIKEIS